MGAGAPRRTPVGLIIGLVAGGVALVLCAVCGIGAFVFIGPFFKQSRVYYSASGSGSLTGSYLGERGSTSFSGYSSWSQTVTLTGSHYVSLLVSDSDYSSTVSCSISVNGRQVDQSSGTGVVTCSYVLK